MEKNFPLEQKIAKYLADKGYITNVGDVTRALRDILYAEKMVTVILFQVLKMILKRRLNLEILKLRKYTGLRNRNITTNDGQTISDMIRFCPDGVHPSSDLTGESNKKNCKCIC